MEQIKKLRKRVEQLVRSIRSKIKSQKRIVLILLLALVVLVGSSAVTTGRFKTSSAASSRRGWWWWWRHFSPHIPSNITTPTPTPSFGAGQFDFNWNPLSFTNEFNRYYIKVTGRVCNNSSEEYLRFDILAKTSGRFVIRGNGFDMIKNFGPGECSNFNVRIQMSGDDWCSRGSPLTIRRSYRIIGPGSGGEQSLGSVTANPLEVCGLGPTSTPGGPAPTLYLTPIPTVWPISTPGGPTPTRGLWQVTPTAPLTINRADLVCMVQPPKSLIPGNSIPIYITITNQGNIGSTGGETHRVTLDGPLSSSDQIIKYPQTPSLLPGKSVVLNPLTINNATLGQYTVTVNVDIYNRTDELTGEGNNTCSSSFTVGPLEWQ